jgi:hypothetical protein
LERKVKAHDEKLKGLRRDLRTNTTMLNEAKVNKERSLAEADNLREVIEEQEPDSGRIIAYEAAIQVYITSTLLMIGSKRRKSCVFATDFCCGRATDCSYD